MLHTISNSTIDLEMIQPDDAVLFWQNGVNLALENNPLLSNLLAKTPYCYALDSDILARGLLPFIHKNITIIDMTMVVSLTEQYHPQISW